MWLLAFYLAWLIMTPCGSIAAWICIGCIIAACVYSPSSLLLLCVWLFAFRLAWLIIGPVRLHCCMDLCWLCHCCVRLLPIKFAFAVWVAVRILPGLVDYDPMQFHCCINLYWLCHCCAFYLAWLIMTPRNFITPIKFAFAV